MLLLFQKGDGAYWDEWFHFYAALGLGAVLAMTSSFGLQWWMIDGEIVGSPDRMGHLGEFVLHFLPTFSAQLLEHLPWIWYNGYFGTPMWGFQILVFVGAAALVIHVVQSRLRGREYTGTREGQLLLIWVLMPLAGYILWAAMIYWWPAGVSDRPIISILSLPLILLAIWTALHNGLGFDEIDTGSSSSSSLETSYRRAPETRSVSSDYEVEQARYVEREKSKSKKEADANRKIETDRLKKRDKKIKDDEEKAEKLKKKDAEDDRKREYEARKAADDLAWRLKEKAEHEAWKEKERQKDEEHRRKNSSW